MSNDLIQFCIYYWVFGFAVVLFLVAISRPKREGKFGIVRLINNVALYSILPFAWPAIILKLLFVKG